ncbi:hypothetical protein ACI6Q2_14340 [Chitinophagaceae bacterium LWZ2-11]
MKKTLVLSLSALIFFAACKKDDGGGSTAAQATMSAKMDGTSVAFDSTLKAKWANTTVSGTTVSALSITGYKTTGGDGLNLQIIPVSTANKVIAGTYLETNTNSFYTEGVYFPKDSASSKIFQGFIAGISASPANPLQVVITSIDNVSVKGTFKGDFYYTFLNTADSNYYYSSSNKKTFTDGTFTAKF